MRFVKTTHLDMNGDVDCGQNLLHVTFKGLDKDTLIKCTLDSPTCQASITLQEVFIPLSEVVFISPEFEGEYSISSHDE